MPTFKIIKEVAPNLFEKALKIAKKRYGGGQYLLDVPSKIGRRSFSYFNDKNTHIIVYSK